VSEALPVFGEEGGLRGFVATSADFLVVGRVGGGRRFYLLTREGGVPVEPREYRFDGLVLDVRSWAVYSPLQAWRSLSLLEDLVSWIERGAGWRLRGRRLLLSYSGGKDSTAALILLDLLYERVGFRLEVVHVHMPYLEPEYHVDEAVRLASRLGYGVEVLEPPRRVLARRMLEEGLPWRRARWCTYYKTRPLEEYFERGGFDYMVVGDRVWESLSRSRRLRPETLFDRERFEPVKHLSLVDVVLLVRSYGLVHRDYTIGLPRVSCRYCPYKSLYELILEEGVGGDEDPGLIEEVLRREWRRWYRSIPWEDFTTHHYWRFTPRVAQAFHRLRSMLEHVEPVVRLEEVRSMVRSQWETPVGNLEALPRVTLPWSRLV